MKSYILKMQYSIIVAKVKMRLEAGLGERIVLFTAQAAAITGRHPGLDPGSMPLLPFSSRVFYAEERIMRHGGSSSLEKAKSKRHGPRIKSGVTFSYSRAYVRIAGGKSVGGVGLVPRGK